MLNTFEMKLAYGICFPMYSRFEPKFFSSGIGTGNMPPEYHGIAASYKLMRV
jgi:hypothetical protein